MARIRIGIGVIRLGLGIGVIRLGLGIGVMRLGRHPSTGAGIGRLALCDEA